VGAAAHFLFGWGTPTVMVNNQQVIVHPLWLRATHWINAAGILVMVSSGWRIYNASPLFPFRFPEEIALGGWLAGALLWHFAAMWLVAVNGLFYLAWNLLSGRMVSQFLPISLQQVRIELGQALRLELMHPELRVYNAVQRLAYLCVWIDIAVLVLSGLVLWKSVQFPILRTLLGGYEMARLVHFAAMAALVGFTLVHLVMVAVAPRSLLVMLRGARSRS
jgi:thiosulfate reductase cytochrome b subunit